MKSKGQKDERSFPFLRLNELESKPRKRGLTEIRGPYYSAYGRRHLEDLFETMSPLRRFAEIRRRILRPHAGESGARDCRALPQIRCARFNRRLHRACPCARSRGGKEIRCRMNRARIRHR